MLPDLKCEKLMSVLTESKKRQYIAEGNKSKWFRNLSEGRKSEIVEKYMSSEFLDLKCDWAFKFVMSSPEILIILLNDFLPETVTEVVSVSTEPKRLGGSEKNVLMDVVARTADGREIVIEMSEMDYVEGWLHILRESVNFAGVPEGMDAHFSPVVEAARLQTVPEDEMMNYFKSVISDNERLEYGEDRFAEGLAEGLEKGKAEGLATGLAKGLSNGKVEVARNLLSMGISSEIVAKATGLSANVIAAL